MSKAVDPENCVKSKMADIREEAKFSKSEINLSKGEAWAFI